MQRSNALLAQRLNHRPYRLWGAPGKPIIRFVFPKGGVPKSQISKDMVCSHLHDTPKTDRLLHYMGKHVPAPQKSLWSPDTPVPQDRHLFKLTTLDVDAFKYWFGVKRATVHKEVWKVLWRSGILPPSFHQHNSIVRRPIFSKEELYRYYLANRKSAEEEKQRDYKNYKNSVVMSAVDVEARRPKAPYL